MPNRLYTVGYEGRVQEGLLDLLIASGVRTLIDVRAVPVSRKAGFSKRILAASAEARGLGYCHIQALGTPKPGRQAARAGRVAEMEQIFADHMQGEAPLAGLARASNLASAGPVCLLCFEHDPMNCHRRLVADMIVAETGMAVEHL
jgi:uncharacterized protein (DUF488 family)